MLKTAEPTNIFIALSMTWNSKTAPSRPSLDCELHEGLAHVSFLGNHLTHPPLRFLPRNVAQSLLLNVYEIHFCNILEVRKIFLFCFLNKGPLFHFARKATSDVASSVETKAKIKKGKSPDSFQAPGSSCSWSPGTGHQDFSEKRWYPYNTFPHLFKRFWDSCSIIYNQKNPS